MAVEFTGNVRRTSEYRALPEDIEIRAELNGRHDKPDIEWLIQDILKHGQHTPVLVWNDGGQMVLAAGFSRWRAVSEINKRGLTPKPLELRCAYTKCNERSAFLLNISENRFRNETTPVDDAHNIQRLLNSYQMTEEEIAKIYFPTAATSEELKKAVKWVKDRISLISLTPEAEEAVKTGRVAETAAAAISKLTSAQQHELLKKEGKITGKDVKAMKPATKKSAKRPTLDPELKRHITGVLESAPWDSYIEQEHTHIEVNAISLAGLKNYVEETFA